MKWISIKDEEPMPCDPILLGSYINGWTDKGCLAYDGRYYADEDNKELNPTHWADLPLSPQVESTHEF